MKRAIRTNARTFAAMIGLVVVAAGVAGFILLHQRIQLPWENTYEVRAEFVNAQAITPGQGQAVTVAGVDVGEISSVKLDNGHALVTMSIKRGKLSSVARDATMLLRPKTPLQDISVDLHPGPPGAPSIGDRVISIRQTRPEVNLDEVLAGLDTDTRAYMVTTLSSLGRGLGKRGENLRRALKATSPTAGGLRRLDTTLAGRRTDMRQLVTSLRSVTGALADQRQALEKLVSAGSVAAETVASESAPLARSLDLLPGDLAQAHRVVDKLTPFSQKLAATASDLVPVATHLNSTMAKLKPFAQDSTPTVNELRRLVPPAIPLAQQLDNSLTRLRPTTPQLARAVKTVHILANELGYIPGGADHSYLFWLSWFSHNANSFLSTRDATSGLWRAVVNVSCTNVSPLPQVLDALKPVVDLAGSCGPTIP